MLDAIAAAPTPARLRALLEESARGLDEATVALARDLGAERAGEVAGSLLESELARPRGDGTARRAALLAGELRLARALPALVRCTEALPAFHPLRPAVLAALSRLEPHAPGPLLAAFDRSRTPEARARVAEALSLFDADDARVRAALVRMLADDAATAAGHLARRGEWRAVPDLLAAAERSAGEPPDGCLVCQGIHLAAIDGAVRELGARLPAHLAERVDEVLEEGEALWTRLDGSPAGPVPSAHGGRPPLRHLVVSAADPGSGVVPLRPAAPASRLGRNDPCPCGSGKKWKRCCLDGGDRCDRH